VVGLPPRPLLAAAGRGRWAEAQAGWRSCGIGRRPGGVGRIDLVFTAVYNLLGIALTSVGLFLLIFAAAPQFLPDLGILANSARLMRGRPARGGLSAAGG
jgi:hypothetical protein